MSLHTHWRDCQAWRDEDLTLSTTSNEAAKLYDALLTQFVGWYDESSVGGVNKTMESLQKSDPNFVMGQVLCNGVELLGTGSSIHTNPDLKMSIDRMCQCLSNGSKVTQREHDHVNAVKLWADGYTNEACDVWDNILVDHPTDMLALKFTQDSYFYLGFQSKMRDSVARVLPRWKPYQPLYNYLMGMYSFGLVETNFYAEAEKVSKKGLELNPRDAWSTHALAHVLEMTGRQNEGISFLSTTLQDWTTCDMLACHNFWHWAIYHIEKGEYQAALDIFDNRVDQRVKKHTSGGMLDIMDATSLLYRLQLEGVDVGDRWNDVHNVCKSHSSDHILAFNDVHVLMASLGAKKSETTEKFITSIQQYVKNGIGQNSQVTSKVGLALCQAFVAYDNGQYTEAVNLLNPIRYQVVTIGGSNAQRDVFNLFLISAALKSTHKDHHRLARSLLLERKALKENAPMTDRLMARVMSLHID